MSNNADSKRNGPGPKSRTRSANANTGRRPSTDSPESPEPGNYSSGNYRHDANSKPEERTTDDTTSFEVDEYGYAEIYNETSQFQYKGVTLNVRETADVQNVGGATVFRRTQELEGDTDLLMSEVVKHLIKSKTTSNDSKSYVTFEDAPEDQARERAYADVAIAQLEKANRQYVSVQAQTDAVNEINAANQTDAVNGINAATQTEMASACRKRKRESSASVSGAESAPTRSKQGRRRQESRTDRRTLSSERDRDVREIGSPDYRPERIWTANEGSSGSGDTRRKGCDDQQRPNSRRPLCLFCQADHPLCRCTRFRALDGQARWEFVEVEVEQRGGCAQCFRMSHATTKCWSLGCPYCGGPHNSLLCNRERKR